MYKGGRWRYSGGMCRAGVCECIKVAGWGTVEACVVLVCVCIKVAGGGTVEACVALVCVYKGGRWRYSGGMCGAGVCV